MPDNLPENIFKLNLKLTLQKRRLVNMAMKFGLQDPRVIAQSRKVDRLVLELQKRRVEGAAKAAIST